MEKHFISQLETKPIQFVQTHFGQEWLYQEAFKEQLKAVQRVSDNLLNIEILSGIHSPVYTLGKSIKNIPSSDSFIPFVSTDRGGQLMYHGSGQLTLYPIFNLSYFFKGPRDYSKFLFDTCILYFKKQHQRELRCKENGLWFEEKKVGFLGLRIKEGVVYHGLSLNYGVDLKAFLEHSPCDIAGDRAGNLFEGQSLSAKFFKEEASRLSGLILAGLRERL